MDLWLYSYIGADFQKRYEARSHLAFLGGIREVLSQALIPPLKIKITFTGAVSIPLTLPKNLTFAGVVRAFLLPYPKKISFTGAVKAFLLPYPKISRTYAHKSLVQGKLHPLGVSLATGYRFWCL